MCVYIYIHSKVTFSKVPCLSQLKNIHRSHPKPQPPRNGVTPVDATKLSSPPPGPFWKGPSAILYRLLPLHRQKSAVHKGHPVQTNGGDLTCRYFSRKYVTIAASSVIHEESVLEFFAVSVRLPRCSTGA